MTGALRAALAAVPPGVTAFSLPLLPGASAALTALALGRL